MVARMLTRDHSVPVLGNEGIPFGSVWWFIYAGISCLLVLFAGIMSGLTLGLMSLGLVDLEILERSGSPAEKAQAGTFFFLYSFPLNLRIASIHVNLCARVYVCMYVYAAVILPVVKKQHQLLVTLLLCNAVAMEVIRLHCSLYL